MVKNNLFMRLVVFVFVFSVGILLSVSTASAQSSTEPVISNDLIIGTWVLVMGQEYAILQFSQSGQGREYIIDQSTGFKFIFFSSFEYTMTAKTIRMEIINDSGGKTPMPLQYEMAASGNELKIHNYVDDVSVTFQRQTSTPVEGIWRRTTSDGTIIEYLFSGGILVKVQNGKPFAFGDIFANNTILTLTEKTRDIGSMIGLDQMWVQSTVSQENYQYRLSGNFLRLTNNEGEIIYSKQ
jgi:hypothetical protein